MVRFHARESGPESSIGKTTSRGLTFVSFESIMIRGSSAMPAKAASARVTAKIAAKSVRANGAKPRAKAVRLSKLEARRLESFKSLMAKYGGKLAFAGYDE
jgi:hypothetical protein